MKNTNLWNMALALGAILTISTGANAQNNPYGNFNNPYGNSNNGPIITGGGILFSNGGLSVVGSPYYGSGYWSSAGSYNAGQGYYAPGYNSLYGGNGGGYVYNPYSVFDSGAYYGNYYGNPAYYSTGNANQAQYDQNNPYTNVPYGTDANGNNGVMPGQNVPANAPNYPPVSRPAPAAAAAAVLPRTTDTIEARRVGTDRFYIGWQGDNTAVNKITFAMLDLKKHPLMTRTVLQPPGQYTFPITSRMVYYQVVVEYVNGTTNTVTSPL